jgi:integrase
VNDIAEAWRKEDHFRVSYAQRGAAAYDVRGSASVAESFVRPSWLLYFVAVPFQPWATESAHAPSRVDPSLLTGARTEEMRALSWDHVDLVGKPHAELPVPPSIEVWRSVRSGGDTKTRRSRRTLALPLRCVQALEAHRERQAVDRAEAGKDWQESGLVFTSKLGTALDRHNVLRSFRILTKAAGLAAGTWSPRELRHSFVSLLSDDGVSIEDIADLCGHAGTAVTERVYRHQLRPVLLDGAVAMDRIFALEPTRDDG